MTTPRPAPHHETPLPEPLDGLRGGFSVAATSTQPGLARVQVERFPGRVAPAWKAALSLWSPFITIPALAFAGKDFLAMQFVA